MALSVLIVDDHLQIAQSVMRDLARADGLEPIGCCRNASMGEAAALKARPDVVLMDIQMPGKDPFDSCLRIVDETRGGVRVLFWTGGHREDYVLRCQEAGGSGIVSKGYESFAELLAVIENVAAGETYWSPDWHRRLGELDAGHALTPLERLTPREVEILCRMADGALVDEIAEVMDLRPRTIHKEIADARTKLNARTNEQLIYNATLDCILSPSSLATLMAEV